MFVYFTKNKEIQQRKIALQKQFTGEINFGLCHRICFLSIDRLRLVKFQISIALIDRIQLGSSMYEIVYINCLNGTKRQFKRSKNEKSQCILDEMC